MFSGSFNPTELMRIISHQTGSGKSKMVAIKLAVLISQLVDKIGTRFQPMLSEFINPTKILRIIYNPMRIFSHLNGSEKQTR